MKLSILILFIFILSCNSNKRISYFELDLANKNLEIIPDSVFQIKDLTHLHLGNSFTMYPPLSGLGKFDVSGDSMNKIKIVPESILKLDNLVSLNLCANDLSHLPKNLFRLKNLDSLDISFNQNLNIGQELQTLIKIKDLKYLNIAGTTFTDSTILKLKENLKKTNIITDLN